MPPYQKNQALKVESRDIKLMTAILNWARLKKLVNCRLLNNDDGSNDDDDDTDADVVTKLRRMTTTTTTKLPVVVQHPWNNIKRISDTTGIKMASCFCLRPLAKDQGIT